MRCCWACRPLSSKCNRSLTRRPDRLSRTSTSSRALIGGGAAVRPRRVPVGGSGWLRVGEEPQLGLLQRLYVAAVLAAGRRRPSCCIRLRMLGRSPCGHSRPRLSSPQSRLSQTLRSRQTERHQPSGFPARRSSCRARQYEPNNSALAQALPPSPPNAPFAPNIPEAPCDSAPSGARPPPCAVSCGIATSCCVPFSSPSMGITHLFITRRAQKRPPRQFKQCAGASQSKVNWTMRYESKASKSICSVAAIKRESKSSTNSTMFIRRSSGVAAVSIRFL